MANTATAADELVRATREFVDALLVEQRATAIREFTDDARYDWHYIPKSGRKGLPLGAMTGRQAALAHAVLQAALSETGYGKTEGIMRLEGILGEIEAAQGRENARAFRDPGNYFVTVFGEPVVGGDWGLSFEGHHVSLNFTVAGGEVVASSPAFLGANPHRVPQGEQEGWRVLGAEEDRARALLASLDAAQLEEAVVTPHAPRDLFSGAERRVPSMKAEGLPAWSMTAEQKELLHALILEYADNVAGDAARERHAQIESGGDDIWFAWMGSTERGEPHYYVIQAPEFLIEYDNVQNGANHSHTVWRDFDGDFGRDVLAEHHAAHPH